MISCPTAPVTPTTPTFLGEASAAMLTGDTDGSRRSTHAWRAEAPRAEELRSLGAPERSIAA
eukprot:scaffold3193_cov79-Isochrysis_galbana.AAC.2